MRVGCTAYAQVNGRGQPMQRFARRGILNERTPRAAGSSGWPDLRQRLELFRSRRALRTLPKESRHSQSSNVKVRPSVE